jgi:hypothetical protein
MQAVGQGHIDVLELLRLATQGEELLFIGNPAFVQSLGDSRVSVQPSGIVTQLRVKRSWTRMSAIASRLWFGLNS